MDNEHKEQVSRRRFLQTSAIAGVSISISSFPLENAEASPSQDWQSPVQPKISATAWGEAPGLAKARVEGLAKVTGSKIYAHDFRAKDIPNWPKQALSVFILRAAHADKIFKGLDLSSLPKHLQPSKVITAAEIERDHIQLPWFYPEPLFVKKGETARYLGQAIALVYFRNHSLYREALPLLLSTETLVTYGKQVARPTPGLYGETRFVRYAAGDKDLFSTVKDGPVNGPWPAPDAKGPANARAMFYARKIEEDIKQGSWQVFEGSYETQVTDPMFMEGEAGLGYYDLGKKSLQLLMGTQSPQDDAEFSAVLVSDVKCPYKVKQVVIHPCFPGGGFGGRDHSLFSMYVALAAIYGEGKPVRLVQSRVEQFQGGIKRHATRIKETLAVDAQGKFQALGCDMLMNGGGQNNFSFAVAAVGAHNAPGAYYFPRAHIYSVAQSTPSVVAGSMRGFGTLQSMFALECLVDEAAEKLKMDPIDLRLKNVMTSDLAMITGAKPIGVVRSREILEKMREHQLWKNRKSQKAKTPGHLYGVGAAMALKTYGTAIGDAVMASLSLGADGTVTLISNGIDMGNGSATSFSVAVAKYLGANATHLKMGATFEFDVLQMTGNLPKDQAELDSKAQNPRWSPIVSMATAASTSAFNQMHVIVEGAKLILEQGLKRAAIDLWGASDIERTKIRWEQGRLTADGFKGLSLPELAKEAHKRGYVVAATAHAYFMGLWASADYTILGEKVRLPLDGLALQYGGNKHVNLLTRDKVEFPPLTNNHRNGVQTYTPCGVLIAVEVDPATGQTKVVEAQEFIDAGPVIVRQNVEGQSQGGIAMGIGHALFEHVPEYEGGPGEGGWNLDRYRVVRAAEIPLHNQELHVLAPLSPDEPAKGIAEIVMIPVLPAVVNAIAAATGKRFRSLPVTADKVKEALHG